MAGRFRPLILGLFNSGLVLDHTFADDLRRHPDDQKRAGHLGSDHHRARVDGPRRPLLCRVKVESGG